MPTPNLNSFFLWNSGSEAVEAAIKVPRKYTGKNNIIVFQGSYHGRTYGQSPVSLSFSSRSTQITYNLLPLPSSRRRCLRPDQVQDDLL